MRIRDYHIATHRAGSAGYQIGRQRGQIAVWHDDKLYLYRRPYKSRPGEIKSAIIDAWSAMHAVVRVSGRFPEYAVSTGN